MKWMQYTYVNGELKYSPKIRTADDMVRMMAAMHFHRQAGADVTVGVEENSRFETTAYIFHRVMSNRIVINRFEKIDEE